MYYAWFFNFLLQWSCLSYPSFSLQDLSNFYDEDEIPVFSQLSLMYLSALWCAFLYSSLVVLAPLVSTFGAVKWHKDFQPAVSFFSFLIHGKDLQDFVDRTVQSSNRMKCNNSPYLYVCTNYLAKCYFLAERGRL